MITKPRSRRAETITPEEHDCHHWLGRLAMCLAISSHEMPDHLRNHARKTLDEFLASGASSEALARVVRDEVKS
jgi:hypothetical protein